jgi:hypothetical protein
MHTGFWLRNTRIRDHTEEHDVDVKTVVEHERSRTGLDSSWTAQNSGSLPNFIYMCMALKSQAVCYPRSYHGNGNSW